MQVLFKENGQPKIMRFVKSKMIGLNGGLFLILSDGSEKYINPEVTDVQVEDDSHCEKCGHVWGCYEDYCKCPTDEDGWPLPAGKPAT